MPYDRQNVLTGERAYQVLKRISESEEGSYGTEIAEEIDTTQQVVSEIISILKEMELVEKGKRTQAQYYEVNFDGFSDLFKQLVEKNLLSEASESQKEAIKDYLEGELESMEGIRFIEEIEDVLYDDVDEFISNYVRIYLSNVNDSNINKMLLDDFFFGVNTLRVEELPLWLSYLKLVREETYEISENPAEIILKALEKQE